MSVKCPNCNVEAVMITLIRLDALLFVCPSCNRNIRPIRSCSDEKDSNKIVTG